jgi:hypothetical protein
MTRQMLVLAGAVLVAGATLGCDYDGKAGAAKASRESARMGAPLIAYQEVPYEGRIYVVSSAKSAESVSKGVPPAIAVTKIGKGPKKETIVFEADKSYVEDALITEYNKRHGTTIAK